MSTCSKIVYFVCNRARFYAKLMSIGAICNDVNY